MYDIDFIISHPDEFISMLKMRCIENAEELCKKSIDSYNKLRNGKTRLQELQQRRNEIAEMIGNSKSRGIVDNVDTLVLEAESLRDKINKISSDVKDDEFEMMKILDTLPNVLDNRVPTGIGENENILIKEFGKKREMGFQPKEHFELGEALGLMDFETTANISGSRFVNLYGGLALLERALGSFMLNHHISRGFFEVSTPFLVKEKAMYNAGQLPKFTDDSFVCDGEYRLIPTSEVSLVNLYADSRISSTSLPKRFVSLTDCFRSEAGSAGKDTRGMIRLHQFKKVELVTVCSQEKSEEEHLYMLQGIEEVMQKLGLHYRVMVLSSGDIGFSSSLTYDVEVWLPGQGRYREISSCSNCRDFQARRMMGRYYETDIEPSKNGNKKKYKYLHTLNGSGIAVGRALVAIMENYQDEDGNIKIPEVLFPYCNGIVKIMKNSQNLFH